jgi:hypothetical protein
VLSKLTIAAAVVFMLVALLISMPALTGNVSVLNAEAPADAPAEAPAAEQQTQPVNSNIVTDNANSALIETPATNSFSQQAANSASNTAPAADASEGATNAPANK